MAAPLSDQDGPSTRFRFKSHPTQPTTDTSSEPPRKHKRRRLSPPPPKPLDPTTAFRESLFDALADDEGAAYWEGVYGQPIHHYSDQKRDDETGELEKMTEEEYVAYVRREMWERSVEGVEAKREERRREEREEGRREKRREREEEGRKRRRRGDEEAIWDRSGRGREETRMRRSERKMWVREWRGYQDQWLVLLEMASSSANDPDDATGPVQKWSNGTRLLYPIQKVAGDSVDYDSVRKFYVNCAKALSDHDDNDEEWRGDLMAMLKVERVKWHPDKMQQRLKGLGEDDKAMKKVTEVFQIVDRLWEEFR